MKRRLIAIAQTALTVVGLAVSQSSWAFETNEQGHGGITRDALQTVSITLGGETLKFTDRAILETRKANFDVDWHQLAPEFHFDDETLGGGSQRINAL